MKLSPTTLIVTVLNESKTIEAFLHSVIQQTVLPKEIIIVDGGSHDRTPYVVKKLFFLYKKQFPKIRFLLLSKKGNRSIGRNKAIQTARYPLIACSDAGCILDKRWLDQITRPFQKENIDVVAGYYKGLAKNLFEDALIPYVLVMPDKAHGAHFLPSSRSMAFTKAAWKQIGGFPIQYSHNEDYVFAKRLKQSSLKIVFVKSAITFWIPRKNFIEAFYMFYRFALGDAEASIFRFKVLLIFVRYVVFLLALFLVKNNSFLLIIISTFIYSFWSTYKNYRYLKNKKAFVYLPLLQIVSDIAVIIGTLKGTYNRILLA